jgi:hypothetical protein
VLQAFQAERASWRAVIQLNVVRSIRLILEAIAEVQALQAPSTSSSPRSANRSLPSSRPPSSRSSPSAEVPKLTPDHLKLRLRLLPLLQVEELLIRRLMRAGTTEQEAARLGQVPDIADAVGREKEVAVNSHFVWRGMFSRVIGGGRRQSLESEHVDWDDPDVSL